MGWYKDESTYCIMFKDGKNEVSYQEYEGQEYEYLTISSYNSSLAYFNLIKEFFKLNANDDKDVNGYQNELTSHFVNIKRIDYATMYFKYFSDDIKFDYQEISKDNYKVTISSTKSIQYLLNVSYLFFFFIAIKNGDNLYIEDGLKTSFIELMKRVRAPYFIRYIFKSNFMVEGNKKHLEELEKECDNTLKLVAGNLGNQRKKFILDSDLYGKNDIIDFGCGEGRLTFALAERLNKKNIEKDIYSVDKETELLEYITKKANNKQLDNIITYDSIETLLENNNQDFDVLCTEVIEHNELKDITKTIKYLSGKDNIKSLLITTPNKDFNRFYKIEEDDSRHDDHKFEFTKQEFISWVDSIKWKRGVEYHDIGDCVDDVYPTLCVILK